MPTSKVVRNMPKPAASPLAERRELSAEETFASNAEGKSDLVCDLIGVARGVQLILWHASKQLSSSPDDLDTIVTGLSMALRTVIEPCDAYYFTCLGELNTNIPPRHLALLLEKELEKVRAKMANVAAR